MKANAGARPGDALVFTKRIGTGVIATALKRGMAAEAHVAASIEQMLTLNRRACEAMLRFDVHGCTDVTGFGLIGHAREMALASGVTLEIEVDAVRFLPGAVEYARQGALPGGLQEQPRVRVLRRGGTARTGSRNRSFALRPANLRRPADFAAAGRRRGTRAGARRARIASAGCCRERRKRFNCYDTKPDHRRPGCGFRPGSSPASGETGQSASAFTKWGWNSMPPPGVEFVRELIGGREGRFPRSEIVRHSRDGEARDGAGGAHGREISDGARRGLGDARRGGGPRRCRS